ncbi:squalene/phytoene synthase family protein [Hyphobacterium sp. HN65]|uniref:Squalene/phytoene synthase family protein n=1 Tax=Hyphobacterium lacteum TaxID=3116575 RepID=A0ABU7LTA5_9PROT|nr:squalene/phytoene synthase family protein [Hyphobacterium sp. HN65]MEE2527150.1 squalene/phytoene synthase family protein [Hyphobacterium sp. HN65]
MSVTAENRSDRELAAMFAPADVRQRLLGFYAWLEEIEQIPVKAREPAIQAMRFAWHREAVSDLFLEPPKVRRHDAYEGLAGLLEVDGPTQAELTGIINAIEDGLDPDGLANGDVLLSLIDAHHGQALKIGLRLAGADSNEAQTLAAGRAAGLAHWLGSFAFRAGRQLAVIPQADLAMAGLNTHRLATGREPDLAKLALAPILDHLEDASQTLRLTGKCASEAFPVMGAARLARGMLKQARATNDPYRSHFDRPLLARQWELLRASISGRL